MAGDVDVLCHCGSVYGYPRRQGGKAAGKRDGSPQGIVTRLQAIQDYVTEYHNKMMTGVASFGSLAALKKRFDLIFVSLDRLPPNSQTLVQHDLDNCVPIKKDHGSGTRLERLLLSFWGE